MGEPLGEGATRRNVGGKIIYGGGGDSAPEATTRITEQGPTTEKSTSSTKLPDFVTSNTKDIFAKAKTIGDTPYTAYTGNRVAEFTPDMLTAMERMRNQGVAGEIDQASGLASLAGQRASDYGMFQQGVQQYMNPYMQNVVDVERRKAQETADRQSAILSGQAAKQGAFGGSGAALQQRGLTRDTAQQLADIQALGLDRAYRSASDQYNTGITNMLSASGQLGGLGTTRFGQETDLIKNLGTSGDIQRQREQALLDEQYRAFTEAQDDPAKKLALQKSLTSGLEYDTSTEKETVIDPGKKVEQVVGSAAGGLIGNYAEGGITSLLSDQQIDQRQQMPNISDLARMSLQAEEMERAQVRAAQQGIMAQMTQQPQGTVADEEMARIAALEGGIGGLDVPDDMIVDEGMAGGGIVAFQNRGEVPAPNTYRNLSFEDLKPYREGAYLRSRNTRIDPITNQPIEFGDFLRLQQAEVAQAARPVAQSIIQAAPAASSFIPTDASDNRFARKPAPDMSGTRERQGIAQLLTPPAARRTQVAPTDTGPAPSSQKRSSMLDDMYGPIETEVRAIGAAERRALEDMEKDIKDEAKEGNSFADKARERINARLKGLEGQDKVALENSILNFGFGLLAASGEKNKRKALGELGLNTLKGHSSAMKDLQAKQERYEDAELELQKIEMGERRATRKDIRDLQLKKSQAENGVRKTMADIMGKRADTVFDMYKLEETNRNALRVANVRGAGAGAGVSKAVKDAEAAYARDPQALALKKQLENPVIAGNRTKRETAENQLRLIRADKYRQFGATLEDETAGATGAGSDPLGIL
jgi:hypothetical protein